MKPQDKIAIDSLRSEGKSIGEIAQLLNLSPNTLRSHIRRHPTPDNAVCCMHCGKPVLQPPHHRKKRFCSYVCRMQWWRAHPEAIKKKAYYVLTCCRCGKEFTSYGNKNRKYCCRECYIASRRSVRSGSADQVSHLTSAD